MSGAPSEPWPECHPEMAVLGLTPVPPDRRVRIVTSSRGTYTPVSLQQVHLIPEDLLAWPEASATITPGASSQIPWAPTSRQPVLLETTAGRWSRGHLGLTQDAVQAEARRSGMATGRAELGPLPALGSGQLEGRGACFRQGLGAVSPPVRPKARSGGRKGQMTPQQRDPSRGSHRPCWIETSGPQR